MGYLYTKAFSSSFLLKVLFVLFISNTNVVKAETAGNGSRFTFESQQMGTLFRITLYSDDPQVARMAADSAFQRVAVLNSIFSDYIPDSELQMLSDMSGSDRHLPVSDELFDILKIAHEVSLQTGGSFDVTAGPFTHEWRAVIRGLRAVVPGQDEIETLSGSVGYEYISFQDSTRSIALKAPDMQLDLGGIGKGFAAMEIWKVMQHFNLFHVLINAGGDIMAGDPPPHRDFWVVTLPEYIGAGGFGKNDSATVSLKLSKKAITTSGDFYQYAEINGKRFSHIVNPHTGLGITQPTYATVIGHDATLTDAYATALSILPPDEGIALINRIDGFEARILTLTQDELQILYSDGFKLFLIPSSDADN
ncbi:MAG: FAD:protein FMN transferase [Balneolaceae bacterium]|nr:MAG: FAD:protein FMN transferase [Balneolaceae bacterium]